MRQQLLYQEQQNQPQSQIYYSQSIQQQQQPTQNWSLPKSTKQNQGVISSHYTPTHHQIHSLNPSNINAPHNVVQNYNQQGKVAHFVNHDESASQYSFSATEQICLGTSQYRFQEQIDMDQSQVTDFSCSEKHHPLQQKQQKQSQNRKTSIEGSTLHLKQSNKKLSLQVEQKSETGQHSKVFQRSSSICNAQIQNNVGFISTSSNSVQSQQFHQNEQVSTYQVDDCAKNSQYSSTSISVQNNLSNYPPQGSLGYGFVNQKSISNEAQSNSNLPSHIRINKNLINSNQESEGQRQTLALTPTDKIHENPNNQSQCANNLHNLIEEEELTLYQPIINEAEEVINQEVQCDDDLQIKQMGLEFQVMLNLKVSKKQNKCETATSNDYQVTLNAESSSLQQQFSEQTKENSENEEEGIFNFNFFNMLEQQINNVLFEWSDEGVEEAQNKETIINDNAGEEEQQFNYEKFISECQDLEQKPIVKEEGSQQHKGKLLEVEEDPLKQWNESYCVNQIPKLTFGKEYASHQSAYGNASHMSPGQVIQHDIQIQQAIPLGAVSQNYTQYQQESTLANNSQQAYQGNISEALLDNSSQLQSRFQLQSIGRIDHQILSDNKNEDNDCDEEEEDDPEESLNSINVMCSSDNIDLNTRIEQQNLQVHELGNELERNALQVSQVELSIQNDNLRNLPTTDDQIQTPDTYQQPSLFQLQTHFPSPLQKPVNLENRQSHSNLTLKYPSKLTSLNKQESFFSQNETDLIEQDQSNLASSPYTQPAGNDRSSSKRSSFQQLQILSQSYICQDTNEVISAIIEGEEKFIPHSADMTQDQNEEQDDFDKNCNYFYNQPIIETESEINNNSSYQVTNLDQFNEDIELGYNAVPLQNNQLKYKKIQQTHQQFETPEKGNINDVLQSISDKISQSRQERIVQKQKEQFPVPPPPPRRNYICRICVKQYQDVSGLHNHRKTKHMDMTLEQISLEVPNKRGRPTGSKNKNNKQQDTQMQTSTSLSQTNFSEY